MIFGYCHPSSRDRARDFCIEIAKDKNTTFMLITTDECPPNVCYVTEHVPLFEKDLTKAHGNRQDVPELPEGPDNPPPEVPPQILHGS